MLIDRKTKLMNLTFNRKPMKTLNTKFNKTLVLRLNLFWPLNRIDILNVKRRNWSAIIK